MSNETFTLTSATQLKDLKSFMSDRYNKFQAAMDEADELDEDTICDMIQTFFIDENLYKVSKAKKSGKGSSEEKTKRKAKKEKDPNKPKRAQSSYMLWLADNREQIKKDHFTDADGNLTLEGRDKVTEVAKKAGELWKTLSDEDKSPYEAKAKELKEQYTRDMEAYSSSPSPSPVSDGEHSDDEEATNHKKAEKKEKTSTKKASNKKAKSNSNAKKSTTKTISSKKGKGKAKAKVNSEDEFESPDESADENGASPSPKAVKFQKHGSDSSDSDSD